MALSCSLYFSYTRPSCNRAVTSAELDFKRAWSSCTRGSSLSGLKVPSVCCLKTARNEASGGNSLWLRTAGVLLAVIGLAFAPLVFVRELERRDVEPLRPKSGVAVRCIQLAPSATPGNSTAIANLRLIHMTLREVKFGVHRRPPFSYRPEILKAVQERFGPTTQAMSTGTAPGDGKYVSLAFAGQ